MSELTRRWRAGLPRHRGAGDKGPGRAADSVAGRAEGHAKGGRSFTFGIARMDNHEPFFLGSLFGRVFRLFLRRRGH